MKTVRLIDIPTSQLIPTIRELSDAGFTSDMARYVRDARQAVRLVRSIEAQINGSFEVEVSAATAHPHPMNWLPMDAVLERHPAVLSTPVMYTRRQLKRLSFVPGTRTNEYDLQWSLHRQWLMPCDISLLFAFGNSFSGPGWAQRVGCRLADKATIIATVPFGERHYPAIQWRDSRWGLKVIELPQADFAGDSIWIAGLESR